MPEFRRSRTEMDAAGIEPGAATACLSGLDVKFVQQRAVGGDQIIITLRAAPFNALGRALEAANPFALRAQAAPPARWPSARWVEPLRWGPGLPRLMGENASRRSAGRRAAARLRVCPP
jgi:hypothetical protein